MDDPKFYEKAITGAAIEVDLDCNVLVVDGESFPFRLSELEKKLTKLGGMTKAFNEFGKRIYDVLTGASLQPVSRKLKAEQDRGVMAW